MGSALKTLFMIVVLLGAAMMVLSEWGEVVVIRPLDRELARETRIWVVDLPDGLYVRASPGKGWAEVVVAAKGVSLRRGGRWMDYRVIEAVGAPERDRVNAAMRAKYGFSDRAIGWARDFDASRPLRLEPIR